MANMKTNSFSFSSVFWAVLVLSVVALQQQTICSAHETLRMGRRSPQQKATTAAGTTTPKGYKKLMKKARKRNFRTHHTPKSLLNNNEQQQQQQQQQQQPSQLHHPKQKLPKEQEHQHHNFKKQQPKEKGRKLKRDDEAGGGRAAKFNGQGVGRGAARAAKGGAAETEMNTGGFGVPRGNVPMIDWSNWGTIWVSNGRDSFADTMGGQGDGDNEETSAPSDEDFNFEESGQDWRSQFVQRITPRPTPLSTPPPTPSPTIKAPTPAATPKPTPMSTSAYDADTRGPCQLCSDGGTATMMTRTLIKSTVTCQDIANALAMADADACPMQKQNIPVDIESYCGCPGKSNPSSCTFCPSGKENIWHNISIPALMDWTCEQVETYTSYVTNTQACSEMSVISDLCCGTWEEYWATGDDDTVV